MTAMISLLRGVNVGGHHMIRMEALRALYESIGLKGAKTYVQSGNVVFRTSEQNPEKLALRIEKAIEKEFGFRPSVILRTLEEMREVIGRNPYAGRKDIEGSKLLVTFLAGDPEPRARDQLFEIKTDPEEMHLIGRELYIYFPNGMGRSKLPFKPIEKALKTPGTARNWNSVIKLAELAASFER